MRQWLERNWFQVAVVAGGLLFAVSSFQYATSVVNLDTVCRYKIQKAVNDVRWCVMLTKDVSQCLLAGGLNAKVQ